MSVCETRETSLHALLSWSKCMTAVTAFVVEAQNMLVHAWTTGLTLPCLAKSKHTSKTWQSVKKAEHTDVANLRRAQSSIRQSLTIASTAALEHVHLDRPGDRL